MSGHAELSCLPGPNHNSTDLLLKHGVTQGLNIPQTILSNDTDQHVSSGFVENRQ